MGRFSSEVMKIHIFRNFIFARLFFVFSVNMLATIVGWQIFEYTKDEFSLGLIGLAEVIPFVFTAIIGGNIADIIDRKRIILWSVWGYVGCVVALFFVSYKMEFLTTHIGVYLIYIIIFFTGIMRGFLAPAQSAFMAQLVPRRLYGQSATWNSIIWHSGAIGGPALGGILYAWNGAAFTYCIITGLATIGCLLFMSVPRQPMPEYIKGHEDLQTRLSVGLKFVFSEPVMLGAISIDMFAVLFGGAVALLPSFAKNVLAVGSEGLGVLRAAPAVGALLMAGVMAYRPPLKRAGRNLLIAVTGFGLCTIAFALSTNFYLSLVLLALIGAFDNVSVVVRSTILQVYTPDEMRGRVSSVNSIFISSSNELGAFESGLAARLLGLVPSVVFGGGMTLFVVAASAYLAPTLRNLNLQKKLTENNTEK